MNKILLSIAFVLTYVCTNAQTKTFTDLGDSYKTKNFGAMLNSNNAVDGYYNFCVGEKLKKKQREYLIKIYDQDINLVLKKKYVDSKHLILINGKYNGQQIMLCFLDTKEKQYKLIGFDREGNKKSTHVIPLNSKEFMYVDQGKKYPELLAIKNSGFAFMHYTKEKKSGYKITFFPTNGSTDKWTYGTDPKSKYHEHITFAGNSEYGISFYLFLKKTMLSKKLTIITKVINTKTGEAIFEQKEQEETPRLLSNTHFQNGFFVNTGEYFAKGNNPLKDASVGLYFNKYDYTGKLLSSKKTNWNNPVFGKFQVPNNKKNKNHLYIHDFIQTQSGEYYAISEEYKRSASAAGVGLKALAIAGMTAGGGGSIGVGGTTKLTITDSHFIKFDKDFNLLEMKDFEKGKSYAFCPLDFGSAQINAHILNEYGYFDYSYTQTDKNKNRFYSMFIDFERTKGKKNKFALKAVIYNNGKLSEDKIYLSKGKVTTLVYPAKKGHVLLFDYNKKKETAEVHLEKLNIE